MIPKESNHTDRDAEEQESDHTNAKADAQSWATPHIELADGSPLPIAAFHRVVDEVTVDDDGELGRALVTGVVTGDKDSSGLSLPTLLNYYFN